MSRRFFLALLFVLVPAFARAQEAPERILPAGCQVYFHWDGLDKHRDAFDRSGIGKMLNGDTGKFLGYLLTYTRKNLEIALEREPEAKQILGVFDEVIDTIRKVGKHGFVVGIEVKSAQPPQAQAVLVFPENGKTLLDVSGKIVAEAREKPNETQVGKNRVFSFSAPRGEVHFGWFNHAGHGVLVFGTEHPATLAKRAAGGDPGITKNELYKKLAGFKDFKPWARGYLDLAPAWDMVGGLAPEAKQVITDLGLDGLHHITFLSGFEGEAERSIVEIKTGDKRTGLLALLNRKTIKLADLPPLPDDISGFVASNFQIGNLYEGLVQVGDVIAKVATRGEIDVREFIKQFEGFIRVKFKEDLFDCFDGLAVAYASSAEGPLGFGGVGMLKVKDEKKLQTSIEALVKGIQLPIPGFEIKLTGKEYKGTPFHDLAIRIQDNEIPLFSYTIHKGWFAIAGYPQPLYGYILRANGELPSWRASKSLEKRLAAFPKEFTSIAVSDPRPTVQFLLSLAPGITTTLNQFLPAAGVRLMPFDTSVIPHAREATRHLFPNISVSTDDGTTIRIEGRYSLALPF